MIGPRLLAAPACLFRHRGLLWKGLFSLLLTGIVFAGSLAHAQESIADPVEYAASRVVKIFGAGQLRGLSSYGTGFLVSSEGHIATVWSHVLDADSVTVVLHDGRRFEAKLLGAEPPLDLAVIKIDAEGLPCFDLSQTASANLGSRVLAFSNMFKVAVGDEQVTVQHGVVSAKMTLQARRGVFEAPYNGPVYIVDAITNNPGAAGGVLTTYDGRLLGMLGKELRDARTSTWLNYAVPIDSLRSMIEQIQTGNFSAVRERTPPDTTNPAKRYVSRDFGLILLPDVLSRTPPYLDRVVPDSLADKSGLRAGDLVVFLGDTLIPSVRVLNDELGRLEQGGNLRLVVRRDNALVTVELPIPRKD